MTVDNARSMDELHGDVKDLNDNLGRLSLLPPNWSGKGKISDWLDTLSNMEASECLDKNQARQLNFDLESAYQDFNKILHSS